MKKRFVAKRKKKKNLIKLKYLIFIITIYLIYQIGSGLLIKVKLTTSNEEFLLAMMKDSNHHILYKKDKKSFLTSATKFLTGIDMNSPTSTLETVFRYKQEPQEKKTLFVTNPVKEIEVPEDSNNINKETEYIEDPKPIKVDEPRVYIYNTHQLENYSMKNLEAYNITPNVMMASYLLREKLNNNGVGTIVEETNINEYMKLNNWTSKDAYKATKQFIKSVMSKYQNLDLLIDLHRDAISKSSSTVTINGKNYAKVLFVIGLNNPNYKKNMEIAEKLNNMIKAKYTNLSRGILEKKGAGVNGVYNQDVSEKVVLIECGGYENTIDEVSNTIEALSVIITEYLEG